MKTMGWLLVSAGIIWWLVSFNMDTSVATEAHSFGSISIPSMRVNNLGLMEQRRNHLMAAGVAVVVGVLLIGFGSIGAPATSSAAAPEAPSTLKPCPFCAEPIQRAAIKCRYCASELPESFHVVEEPMPVFTGPEATDLERQLASIRRNSAPFEDYRDVMRGLGGNLQAAGGLFSSHYVATFKDGTTARVEPARLHHWFMADVAPTITSGAASQAV